MRAMIIVWVHRSWLEQPGEGICTSEVEVFFSENERIVTWKGTIFWKGHESSSKHQFWGDLLVFVFFFGRSPSEETPILWLKKFRRSFFQNHPLQVGVEADSFKCFVFPTVILSFQRWVKVCFWSNFRGQLRANLFAGSPTSHHQLVPRAGRCVPAVRLKCIYILNRCWGMTSFWESPFYIMSCSYRQCICFLSETRPLSNSMDLKNICLTVPCASFFQARTK